MAGKFEPKEPVQLNAPNYTPISVDDLGKNSGKLAQSRKFASSQHCSNKGRPAASSYQRVCCPRAALGLFGDVEATRIYPSLNCADRASVPARDM